MKNLGTRSRTLKTAWRCSDLARRAKDGAQARRLLAPAAVLDGASREEAAKIGGMDRPTLRDWVIRYNEQGPDGLINIPSPGAPPKLDDTQKAAHTPFSFSNKLDGTAPKTSRLPKTSRSCRCRRVRQSSTRKKYLAITLMSHRRSAAPLHAAQAAAYTSQTGAGPHTAAPARCSIHGRRHSGPLPHRGSPSRCGDCAG